MRPEKLLLPVLLVVTIAMLSMEPTSAANWPRFRGPNGTGVAEDKNIPVEWSEKENLVWKTPIPGLGNSSPVIWGDRIFLQSALADGTDRLLLCLSATDGKILWKQSAPGTRFRTLNARNTYASSTPATDGERVYALFWDGSNIAMTAYDFDGKLLWNRSLGGYKSQHGAGASPMVVEDKVILNHDQDGAAVLLALDSKTGQTVWQAERKPFRACYSTPFLLDRPGGGTELIVASTAGITSYSPKDGSVNWNHTWKFDDKSLRTVGSPLHHQGLIFATSGDGDGSRHMIAVRAGGQGDVSKTNPVWEIKAGTPYVPTLLARGDHLYGINDSGTATCVVAKTGEEVWTKRLDGNVSASPILIDGKVYTANENGDVSVFAAEPTFKLLARNALGEPVLATPAVADGRLYIRGKTNLYCIGKSSSK